MVKAQLAPLLDLGGDDREVMAELKTYRAQTAQEIRDLDQMAPSPLAREAADAGLARAEFITFLVETRFGFRNN